MLTELSSTRCTSLPLRELHNLSWQSAMLPERSHVHFALDTLRCLGQRLEQRQPLTEMS